MKKKCTEIDSVKLAIVRSMGKWMESFKNEVELHSCIQQY